MKHLLLILALLISFGPSFAQTDKDDRDDKKEERRQKKQDRDDESEGRKDERNDRKEERDQRKQDSKEKKQDSKDQKKEAKDEKNEEKGERKSVSQAKVDYNVFRRQILTLNEFTLERHHAADLQRNSKGLVRTIAWVDSAADADENKVLVGYITIVASGTPTNIYEVTYDRLTKKIVSVRGTGERVESEPADKPQPKSPAARPPAARPTTTRPATAPKPAKDSDDEDDNSEEETDDDSDDEDGKKPQPIKKTQTRQRRPANDD